MREIILLLLRTNLISHIILLYWYLQHHAPLKLAYVYLLHNQITDSYTYSILHQHPHCDYILHQVHLS
jgi:hypothetical protein